MQTLQNVVGDDFVVERVGYLPDNQGLKLRIANVGEIEFDELDTWRSALRKDGWHEKGGVDTDDNSFYFIIKKHNTIWPYFFMVVLCVVSVYRLML
jgi:hypothetical protein